MYNLNIKIITMFADTQIMKSNEDEIKALFSILLDKIQEEFECQKVNVYQSTPILGELFPERRLLSLSDYL